MTKWHIRTEAQIKQAQARGVFRNLEGAGKPLLQRPGDATLDAGEAVGFRIMAEAGALPEEIALKRDLDAARQAWQDTTDPVAKKGHMRTIADLEMRYEIARDARRRFLR